MKRLIFCLSVLWLSVPMMAQYSKIYSTKDASYAEGVELYQQGQFAASHRTLAKYLAQPQPTYAEQAEFYLLANAYEMRQKDTQKRLQNYLKRYAYTPYASEVNFMLGTLQAEKERYKQALKFYDKVRPQELSRSHEATYFFYSGYAHLQQGEIRQAATYFADLKAIQSQYDLQARYYYGFCQYKLLDYGRALPEFLAIEHTAQYKNIVPYYIIQIYYAQEQYDEVYARAEYLLKNNPKNENNGELHRILGEIYYQGKQYDKAIYHLEKYEQSFREQDRELVRNDVYLLGMSYYQTGDWDNAVKYLRRVEKANDELTENTYFHIGNACVRLGLPAQAKMAYSTAMRYQLTPTIREEAMYNYALTTYESSTALGESVTAFTDFLREYPQSKYETRIYELLSDVFMHSKNYQAALDALDSIKNPTPQLLETKQYLRYQMGVDAFIQNQPQVAAGYFTAVIDHEAQVSTYKTESYFWRAECNYRLKKWVEALDDINTYLKQSNVQKSENKQMAHYLKGYVLFSQGQYDKAKEAFTTYSQQADESLNTYADALNRVGDCQFNARNFAQAEQTYAKVVNLESTGVDYALFQRGYALGLLKKYDEKVSILNSLVERFPRSDYADDAIYEMARAEIQREHFEEAIKIYDALLVAYPRSALARKAALEKAMLYYNQQEYEQAITNYKKVITNYPATEEAYAALDGLQAAYVEIDKVSEYLAYTKTLGRINMKIDNQEDSLTYIAAERQYMLQNYSAAVAGLGKYISQYCEGGRYCMQAHYYLANGHYLLDNKAEALDAFKAICDLGNSPYVEEAYTRVAEISYDMADYQTAMHYFECLDSVASSIEKATVAKLGILRSSYNLQDHAKTIQIAERILADEASSDMLKAEARYNQGKAYYAQEQYAEAIESLTPLASETRTAQGAEAKYLLCEGYYKSGDIEKAEAEIMSFANMNTQHQYWLAKSFVVLADVFVQRGDDFQAKQYLLSLQTNYKVQDDVQEQIAQRLTQIAECEQAKNNATEEITESNTEETSDNNEEDL